MFPIRDHNPSGRTPYVIYLLMAANILIFLSYAGSMENQRLITQLYTDYAVVPARITDGYTLETLVTSMFLHGGWMHLAGNMLFLWIFGDNLEDEMGHLPFLLFYLAAGIGAGLIHVVTAPQSLVPTIGASGAIAGVMGGYLLMFPKARVDILLVLVIYFRVFSIPAFVMLGVWLGMQFIGSLSSNPDEGGVAYWAHTGGFLVGLLLCIPLWLRRGASDYWNRTHGHPPHPEHKYKLSQSRIPRIPRR
ncbi:rhomboid family intramembrane serine protease [Ruegeria faecimaris]|uniref:Membrane associated serine protease, rhomboid family n=1 Tax=Ruegeria faecimaris TaxID=686389 RepID=A0A521D2N9_9RHOB|nr:rhomboid family intramembrane serine protease [Ruegeria faecimaris]SMO65291.1 Membrane associated serine protease, rhomboid family [Ruegeria faecimaris]